MSAQAEREQALYLNAESEARGILDAAAEASRDTTPEEDERYDRLIDAGAKHKKRALQIIADQADAVRLEEGLRASIGSPEPIPAPNSRPTSEMVEHVVATFAQLKAGTRSGEMVFDLTFDETAIREEVRVVTDFGHGTSLYVSDFQTQIAVYQRTMSPWFQTATIINANNGRPLIIPTSTADPTSYTPGEGTAITAADPTLGTATATPVSYKALGYLSAEAEEDEVVGLMGVIARQQGRSLGLAAGSGFTTSILSGAANGGTASGAGGGGGSQGTALSTFFGYEDLLDLKYGRAAPYRLTGAWVASNGALKKVRKFKDGNGQYLWQPAVALGQPDVFDGQPIYEDPALAAPASVTKSVLYGDLSSVVIKQMPLRVAVSTEYAFNLDNVAIKSVLRAGAAVADPAGIAYLISANT